MSAYVTVPDDALCEGVFRLMVKPEGGGTTWRANKILEPESTHTKLDALPESTFSWTLPQVV